MSTTTDICPLTEAAITALLKSRQVAEPASGPDGRRHAARWPFPGTVELWIPDENGVEWHRLATTLNMSVEGTGIRCDESLPIGLELALAMHEPEMSLHGRAVVRHCTDIGGEYLVGLQFLFDKP